MTCEVCGGTGFVIVERDAREYAERCRCQQRGPAGADTDALARCRIPPRYQHCTLASFDAGMSRHRDALEKTMAFCTGYPHRGTEEGLGLLFSGSNGVGKTHLAVAALAELVATKGARGEFWDFQELMREIKRSYDPETMTTETQVLDPVVNVDVLLLDDLGAWKITDWMNDTLFYILNSRYLQKRPTLITTNFQDVTSQEALQADPLVRREFLVDRIGQRLRSRLTEMCLPIVLAVNDYREARREGNRNAVFGPGASREDRLPPPPPPRPRFGG